MLFTLFLAVLIMASSVTGIAALFHVKMENENTANAAVSANAAKRWPLRRLLDFLALAVVISVASALFATRGQREVSRQVHAAVDRVARLALSDPLYLRSSPEIGHTGRLGPKAVPALRAILREKPSALTGFLFGVKAKWPALAKYFPHLPDPEVLSMRRRVALAVLERMGADALPAVPELIDMLKSGSTSMDVFSAMTEPIGLLGNYTNLNEALESVLETKTTQPIGRLLALEAFKNISPPTPRTINDLIAESFDSEPLAQQRAAAALTNVDFRDPQVMLALKQVQSSSSDPKVAIRASSILWSSGAKSAEVLPVVFKTLEDQLVNSLAAPSGSVMDLSQNEVSILYAAALFHEIPLSASEKSRALADLQSCCQKSRHIFLREELLPAMLQLGLPQDQCLEVCRDGLAQNQEYLRRRAAELLSQIAAKYPIDESTLNPLFQDGQAEVRIHAARADWLCRSNATRVVPVLLETLQSSPRDKYRNPTTELALSTLAQIGPPAKDAIETLSQLTNDPTLPIARSASLTLRRIRADSRVAP